MALNNIHETRRTWIISGVATLFFIILMFSWSTCAPAAEDLSARLKPLIDAHQGEVSVMVKHLESGESYEYRKELPKSRNWEFCGGLE